MEIIQVRRANVILDVPEDQKDEYLAKGFDVLGPDGRVVIKSVPNDMNSLKKAVADLTEENKKLKEENDKLKEQLTSKLAKKVEKVEDEDPEEESDEDFTPINKRGKKNKK